MEAKIKIYFLLDSCGIQNILLYRMAGKFDGEFNLTV